MSKNTSKRKGKRRASINVITLHLGNEFEKNKKKAKEERKIQKENHANHALLSCGPSLNCNSGCIRGETMME